MRHKEQLGLILPPPNHPHTRELEVIGRLLDSEPRLARLVAQDLARGVKAPPPSGLGGGPLVVAAPFRARITSVTSAGNETRVAAITAWQTAFVHRLCPCCYPVQGRDHSNIYVTHRPCVLPTAVLCCDMSIHFMVHSTVTSRSAFRNALPFLQRA